MSLLTNALKQLDAMPADVPVPAVAPVAVRRESAGAVELPPLAEPLIVENALATATLEYDPPPAIAFDARPVFATPPSTLAAPLVAAGPANAAVLLDSDSVTPPEPASGAGAAASEDLLRNVTIARRYTELWCRLTERLRRPFPSTILFLRVGPADGGWIMPLAAAFAQANTGRVLIVDAADPDRGRVVPGIVARHGLVDVLGNSVDWRRAIAQTTTPRIDLLSRGSVRQQRGVPNVRHLAAELKSAYRLVLAVADDASDPLVAALAAAADAAVLVLGLGESSRTAAARAKQSLESCGVQILGCILGG